MHYRVWFYTPEIEEFTGLHVAWQTSMERLISTWEGIHEEGKGGEADLGKFIHDQMMMPDQKWVTGRSLFEAMSKLKETSDDLASTM